MLSRITRLVYTARRLSVLSLVHFFKQFLFANTLIKTKQKGRDLIGLLLLLLLSAGVSYALAELYFDSERTSALNNWVVFVSDFYITSFMIEVGIYFIVMLVVLYLCYPEDRTVGQSQTSAGRRGRKLEFTWLLLISVVCVVALLSSANLIAFYTAIEGLSLVTFFLIARRCSLAGSKELFFKYFCYSSYSSILLGGGFSLLYLLTQSLDLNAIKNFLFIVSFGTSFNVQMTAGALLLHQLLLACSWLIVLGFMFKLGSFPFHFVVPDLYEASSLVFLAFYNFILKQSYLLALIMILWTVFPDSVFAASAPILIVSGGGSLIMGTFGAYIQRNFWRFLGYASVAQTGLVILGLSAGTQPAACASLVFFWGYLAATFLVLLAASILKRVQSQVSVRSHRPEPRGFGYISEIGVRLGGLMQVHYLLGLGVLCVLGTAVLSFAALPPFLGFITKYILILHLVREESLILALLIVVLNLFSTYYYLRIVELLLDCFAANKKYSPGSSKQLLSDRTSWHKRSETLFIPLLRTGSGSRKTRWLPWGLLLAFRGFLWVFFYLSVNINLLFGVASEFLRCLLFF